MTISIDPDLLYSSVQKREANTGNSNLGKDDFLKLLITQLQNQDPLNPMEDREFISQMATFSSLEQMTNMNSSMEKLVQSQTQSSLISFSQFIGQEVTWHKITDTSDPENPIVTEGKGTIQSVKFEGDTVKFYLEDGTELYPANITQMNHIPTGTPLVQASGLIGKEITWSDGDIELTGIVKSVTQKNGVISLLTEDGQTVKINQLVKIL